MAKPDCTIVIPCHNEERSIGRCLENVISVVNLSKNRIEVLVGMNRCSDRTFEIVANFGVRSIEIPRVGYGIALKKLIAAAEGEFIIMGDGDGSYDFSYADQMIDSLRSGEDLCIGNRFLQPMEKGSMPFLNRYLGNPLLSGLTRILFKIRSVRDFHCGLRGFRKARFLDWCVQGDGMEFATEMIIRAHQMNSRISEFPIRFRRDFRLGEPSKLRIFRDGFRHLSTIFALRLQLRRRSNYSKRSENLILPITDT